jgi:hypothetical protein
VDATRVSKGLPNPIRSGPIEGTRWVDREGHTALRAVAQQTHLDALTDAQEREPVAQLRGALERHAVHGDHHVAHFDAQVIGRGARRDLRDLDAARIDELQRLAATGATSRNLMPTIPRFTSRL